LTTQVGYQEIIPVYGIQSLSASSQKLTNGSYPEPAASSLNVYITFPKFNFNTILTWCLNFPK
jgi:hypothetical protein